MDTEDQVREWRKQQRSRLLALRAEMAPAAHAACSERITQLLEQGFALLAKFTVGFCWPYLREYDARFAVRYFRSCGAVAALPLVVSKRAPLQFRQWWPGAPMLRGVYDIPIPDDTPLAEPDAVIVPMNGFDQAGFRLGYGGGFFDRTLASLTPQPIAIGVAFEAMRLGTIYPRPHDVPMDFVVTEAGLREVANGALKALTIEQCVQAVRQLAHARGLPRPASVHAGGAGASAQYSSPVCYAPEFPGYYETQTEADPPAATDPKSG